jgi:hypothetical protein
MLQMLTPVTPLIPNRPENMKPPTAAPTIPSTRSTISPEPVLLRILLAMKPAISPRMIQLTMPMLKPPRVSLLQCAPGQSLHRLSPRDKIGPARGRQ